LEFGYLGTEEELIRTERRSLKLSHTFINLYLWQLCIWPRSSPEQEAHCCCYGGCSHI